MFRVHRTSSALLLEDTRFATSDWLKLSPSPSLPNGIELERLPNSNDGESPSKTNAKSNIDEVVPIHAVYGTYSLLSGSYLAVISDARVVGSGPSGDKIFSVLQVDLIPISSAAQRSFQKHASAREKQDEETYIRMIQSVLHSQTFYFSYEYDLTLSAQKRFSASISTPTGSGKGSKLQRSGSSLPNASSSRALPMWQKAEDDFFWNKPVLEVFIQHEAHEWIIPVISGFVKTVKKCEIDGARCDLLFFTRRSWRRVGTRFNVRGVDKDGYVANFAETETIVVRPDRSLVSYVQIRGSLPLYWDQLVTLKYMPRTRYAFSGGASALVDWNELAFRAHMDTIIRRYGHVTVVNLIDRAGKSATVRDQSQLGSAFQKYVKKYNQQAHTSDSTPALPTRTMSEKSISTTSSPISAASPTSTEGSGVHSLFSEPVAYHWFDFHHECRNMKWHHLGKLLTEVQDQFQHYGWFEYDKDGRLVSRQRGVFRVNCMDNLDRTNVVMSLFARKVLLQALKLSDDGVLESRFVTFERSFKNAWADNADYVSRMYAGTGALKTDFTRTGKRTIAGALQDGVNSVTRYYLNNFSDGLRQDAYDLVVANHVPDKREESPFSFQQLHSVLFLLFEMSIALAVVVGASVSLRPEVEVTTRVRDGIIAYIAAVSVTAYAILKKGKLRSLGRRYVNKPAFSSSGYITKKKTL